MRRKQTGFGHGYPCDFFSPEKVVESGVTGMMTGIYNYGRYDQNWLKSLCTVCNVSWGFFQAK